MILSISKAGFPVTTWEKYLRVVLQKGKIKRPPEDNAVQASHGLGPSCVGISKYKDMECTQAAALKSVEGGWIRVQKEFVLHVSGDFFAISGGLCNLCLDKTNKDYILEASGVEPIINCLSSSNEETVMSAVTTLMYLTTPQSCQQTTPLPVVECMLRFSLSASRRLSNLATVFLEDYCTPLQVEEAKNLSKHTAVGIPLPKD